VSLLIYKLTINSFLSISGNWVCLPYFHAYPLIMLSVALVVLGVDLGTFVFCYFL